MLTHLSIKHLAVVESLDLDFTSGMTIFTGETGAGKSILIDALGLILGLRAESTLVRPGFDSAEISASFDIQHLKAVKEWLHEQNVSNIVLNPDESEPECIIRRVINADGRSRAYINGRLVPIAQLKELGEFLVNIHGQHQHQALLKPEHQRLILDEFGDHQELKLSLRKAYQELQALFKIQKELSSLQGQQDKFALLQYQIQELEELRLEPNEYQHLEQEHRVLTHAGEWLSHCETAFSLLQNELGDSSSKSINSSRSNLGSQGGALYLIHQAQNELSYLKQKAPELNTCNELLSTAFINLEEALNELAQFKENIQLDPQRLTEVEQRLTQIHSLARKHRIPTDQLFQHYSLLKEEAKQYLQINAKTNEITEKIQVTEKRYFTLANELSEARKKVAVQLSKLIVQKMQQLEMSKGQFEIQVSPKSKENALSAEGIDDIEFLVSTNPGLPLQPLRKIASGGELSRISLAIQVITAIKLTTPSLIFDEVDVGISGKTADTVGQLLRQLGKGTQVLCVTHLPQVAAKADTHYKVEKQQSKLSTTSSLSKLEGQDKIHEIARMLGGSKITQNTLASAEEMLEN